MRNLRLCVFVYVACMLILPKVTSLAGNIRDLILRTRSISSSGGGSSSSSSSSSSFLSDLPYPIAVVQQVAAAIGW